MAETCEATTESGDPCKNPASEDDGKCWLHSGKADTHARLKFEPGKIADVLVEECGVVTRVADRLDVTRPTIYNYIRRFQAVRKALEQGRKSLVEEAKDTVLKDGVRDGDVSAALQVLRLYDNSTVHADGDDHSGSDDPQVEESEDGEKWVVEFPDGAVAK